MDILREVNGVVLNKGSLMANGLFNISTDDDVSFWFDADTKDTLMNCDEEDFITRSENIIAESLVE